MWLNCPGTIFILWVLGCKTWLGLYCYHNWGHGHSKLPSRDSIPLSYPLSLLCKAVMVNMLSRSGESLGCVWGASWPWHPRMVSAILNLVTEVLQISLLMSITTMICLVTAWNPIGFLKDHCGHMFVSGGVAVSVASVVVSPIDACPLWLLQGSYPVVTMWCCQFCCPQTLSSKYILWVLVNV